MLQTNYRYKYNPSEINKKDFLASFSVRKEIFQEIFDDIKRTDYSVPSQHFVIIGQRGQGKTTLLRKLYFEIEQDKELSSFLIPLQLTEEQYQIRTLCRLWEVVAEYLELNNSELFKNLIDFMENQSELDDYELNCFNYLEKSIKAQNKKVILLVDNIDELFGKLKDKEQKQLREILLSSSTFKIIGASTKMFEQHYDYAKPFYEFFKIIQLRGLNKSETKEFLKSIANNEQKEKIENIIITQYNKIETLRQLTGGVPRTFVMLFDIFMDEEGNAFDDLIRILDEVTPLYKHRMDDLSPILQDIVHTIALNWDGILTKDIAKKTRLTSSEVSSHLKQLEKYQIIESTSLGKNKIYKIEERFFNIWYLMRFGRKKDRNRVEWLVKFLSTWYTKEELEKKSLQLIEASKEKKIKENYLYYMCEALSYTGLLDLKIEHTLKKNTKEFLEKINSNYATDVSKSVYDLLEKAIKLLEDQKLEDAIMLLEKSKNENQKIFEFLGALYSEQKEYKKAEEYYLKAIENGNNDALNSLGALYSEQKEYKKTEEYYLKAIKNGNNDALNNLGALYKNQKEYKKAEEYFLKAIKNGNNDALNNLGVLYSEQKEYKKAEHYYLKAIETGNNNALNSLGALYSEQKEYKKAEQYFLKAIENGNNIALNNLAILYSVQKEYKKAEEYYLKAIENGSNDALNSLGALYSDQKEYKKAEEYYLKAIENGNNDALNNLGVLYSDQKEYKKAEEYYLKAIENGVNDALNNLGVLYSVQKEYKKAEEYYLKAIENGVNDALNNLAILYKNQKEYKKAEEYYLKAIETGNNNALNSLGALYSVQKEYKKAEEYFLKAIETGNNNALYNLGALSSVQKEYKKAEEYYLKAIENGSNDALNNLGTLYSEQKEYKKAEEYYLKAIENGNNDALNSLGALYSDQKEYKKAEEYYLKAIENGVNDALNNLAILYSVQKEYKKAEEYFLKAIENGVNDALNSLAWFYFEIGIKFDEALSFAEKSYKIEKTFFNTHTFATLLLVKEEFMKSYEKFEEWLALENIENSLDDISIYLILLISKGQYYKAKYFLENEKYKLKDIVKPIWYVLMTFMEKEFPNEIKMMGSELQESVNDILKSIENLQQKYKID